MARTATLKKSTTSKKTASKSKKTTKTVSKAKASLKIVETASAKTKKKPAAGKARPITKKSEAKKPAAKTTKKPAAKKAPAKKVATKATVKKAVAKKAAPKTAVKKKTTATKKKMTARPISVTSGFNRAARINSIVQKRAKAHSSNKKETEFKVNCHVVYPSHGVGQIIDEEVQEIGGVTLKMFVIEFVKDKMTLRVPVHRAKASGLRHVSTNSDLKKMYETLKSKAKISRGMWSRRAQEYEAKINSGDVIMIAEVVRDLHQNVDQAERSYSERMIYESAFNRLAGELSASERMEYDSAGQKLLKLLRAKKVA